MPPGPLPGGSGDFHAHPLTWIRNYNQDFPCFTAVKKTVGISYFWLSFANKISHADTAKNESF